MKRWLPAFGIVFSLSMIGWAKPAASDKAPSKEASAKEADATKASYLNKADQEVQDLTVKIKSLEARSQQSGAKTRDELDRHVKTVDDHLAAAKKKLEDLHASSSEAWATMKNGLEEALAKVKLDYQKALSYFNKNEEKNGKPKKEKGK